MHPALFTCQSAWIPLAMSCMAFCLVAVHVMVFGTGHEADEGAIAHLFQWLIVGQIPIIAFFASTWRRHTRRYVLTVLAWQVLAVALALAPVWYFHL